MASKKAKKKAAPKKKAARKVSTKTKKKASKPANPGTPPAAKPLKPLTLKQRMALIRVDPATGKCPHGLVPETCSFCMNI